MTYEEAVEYLSTFVNYEQAREPQAMRRITLERMRRICERLGDPQRRFRSVLVAGTNAKGSICAMLYSMLRRSTLRVGLYVSPHLEHLRERIRVAEPGGPEGHGEDWISPEAFAAAVAQLQPVLEILRRRDPDGPPTYFEALTAAAFLHFAQRKVDLAVVEVGLGGRLDATNVLEPAVSVIGPIGMDHADVLGEDLVRIAREKAGIIKPGQTVISAGQDEFVEEVIQAACEAHGVPLYTVGRELTARIHQHGFKGSEVTITGLRGLHAEVRVGLAGRHQAGNAAAAVAALEALADGGVPHGLIAEGLARVDWPGRCELVNEAPLVIFDGAHNPQAMWALASLVTECCSGRKVHALLGVSADKWQDDLGRAVGGFAGAVTCTKSRHPRAMDPVQLAKQMAAFCPDVHVMSDAADAYTYLLNALGPDDVLVVTGSLFLVGELRAALRRAPDQARRPAVPDAAPA